VHVLPFTLTCLCSRAVSGTRHTYLRTLQRIVVLHKDRQAVQRGARLPHKEHGTCNSSAGFRGNMTHGRADLLTLKRSDFPEGKNALDAQPSHQRLRLGGSAHLFFSIHESEDLVLGGRKLLVPHSYPSKVRCHRLSNRILYER